MRRLLLISLFSAALCAVAPATATAATSPPQDRDWCRQVTPTPSWSVKNVDVLCRIDTVRHTWNADGSLATDPSTPSGYRETLTQAISINFIDYGNPRPDQPAGAATRDVMFVSGRFGLKSFDITDPRKPKLLDWLGDGIDDPFLEDGNPGNGSQAPRRGTIDDMWENEDMDVDSERKLVFLSRDPRAYGGSTGNPASRSGIYVVDVRNPEHLNPISFAETPTGHTTTCVNGCKWVWTGGPAPNTDQQALGWRGRPIFVTDMRDPHHPKVNPVPIDTARNDGVTDYAHDVQVDDSGVAWVSGRGGVRGYWTNGRHFDPLRGVSRVATADDPIPYGGGGLEENVFPFRTASRFIHNAERPFGNDAPDPSYGDLIFATEEEFAGGGFPNGCANDGPLFISSLEGSYDGQAWRSTPEDKFRLRTVATWHPFGREGSSTSNDCSAHYFEIKDRILSMSFYSQGSRFLDISDPTNPTEVAYFRPGTGTWATYPHKGLYYSADRNGVYVLDLKVTAGQLSESVDTAPLRAAVAADANGPASPVSFSAPDPAEEASAALQRPVGGVCSLPLYE
jgi:hypothetical protein